VNIWREFLIAYNVPGFFLLLFQLFTDDSTEAKWGRRKVCVVVIIIVAVVVDDDVVVVLLIL
jgi:hypothetical protein